MFDRSFFIGEHPISVCARCTGINIGTTVGAGTAFFKQERKVFSKKTLQESVLYSLLHSLMLLPLAADGLVQKYTDYESTNFKRLASGLLYGYGLTLILDEGAWIVLSGIQSLFESISEEATSD